MSKGQFPSGFPVGNSEHEEQRNLADECRAIVVWAGELTEPGEEVGGIGAQNNRAAKWLRLHIGVIERAREGASGPVIAQTIFAARDAFIESVEFAGVLLNQVRKRLKPRANTHANADIPRACAIRTRTRHARHSKGDVEQRREGKRAASL